MQKTVYFLASMLAATSLASCGTSTAEFPVTGSQRIEQPRAICPDCEPPYHPLPVRR